MQTSWFDVHHDVHHADDVTLERIIDVLEADRAAVWSTPRLAPALHLDASRPITVPARVERAAIGDRLLDVRHGDGRSLIDLPADLPFGCHTVMIDTDRGADACVVVVAPANMPRSAEFDGTAGLFVPTYALWEADAPLPSFRHLHHLARAMKSSGIDVVSTLPLYATFLDDPFDPSPYSPISRLHWNEVFLDDEGCRRRPTPTLTGQVDWRTLAARRREQLLEATQRLDADQRAHLATFVAEHPDVADYRAVPRRS